MDPPEFNFPRRGTSLRALAAIIPPYEQAMIQQAAQMAHVGAEWLAKECRVRAGYGGCDG